ncbi:MAG: mechanosensitive ion channel [Alteromonadaceae bacterium]|nr:mechanosensitive ion channel [Alteromonadaceae bacterium]
MENFLELLTNPYVLIYVALIVVIQWGNVIFLRYKKTKIQNKRQHQGLPEDILVKQSKNLKELKTESKIESLVLILPILFLPFVVKAIELVLKKLDIWQGYNTNTSLLFTCLIFIAWLLFSGTNLAKAAIGGIAFRTVMVFSNTFQIGDRVTVAGHSGKLVDIGIFYLTLITVDDDKICIPTNSLWGTSLVTANDGDRSSLVVIPFYLSPSVKSAQLQEVENVIWNAIQASNYFEPCKPKQIYYTQHKDYIELTAKAYVASTYNEPLFKSDITRRFLQYVTDDEHNLLANQTQKIEISRAKSALNS